MLELAGYKLGKIRVGTTMSFAKDAIKHIKNEEDEDFKTNQHLVVIKWLFWKHAVIAQEGMDLNSKNIEV